MVSRSSLCVVLAAALVGGCAAPSLLSPSPGSSPTPPAGQPAAPGTAAPGTAAPSTAPPPGLAASVTTSGTTFVPADLAVAVGTTVTWTSDVFTGHNVKAADGSFGGSLSEGQTVSHTFTAPGVYRYVCSFHAGMAGSITVR